MSIEDYLKIISEDAKKTEALIENDMRRYAELLANIERHGKQEKQLRLEQQQFIKLFQMFGKAENIWDSVHAHTIKQAADSEQAEVDRFFAEVDKRKEYYTALAQEQYEKLWNSGEQASQLAAIYCAWKTDKIRINGDEVHHWGRMACERNEMVARYLVDKLVLAVERMYQDIQALVQSTEYACIQNVLENCSAYDRQDTIWQGIHTWSRMRASESALADCEITLRDCRRKTADASKFLSDYETSKSAMIQEFQKACTKSHDSEVIAVVHRVKKEQDASFATMDENVREWQKQLKDAEKLLSKIEEIRNKLQRNIENNGREEISSAELEGYAEQFRGYTTVKEMEEKQKKLLADLNAHVSEIQTAIRMEAERMEAAERRRVEQREERRRRRVRQREKWIGRIKGLMVACVIIFIISLVGKGVNYCLWAILCEGINSGRLDMDYSEGDIPYDELEDSNWMNGRDRKTHIYLRCRFIEKQVKWNGVLKVPDIQKKVKIIDVPENMKKLVISEGIEVLEGPLHLSSNQEIVLPETLKEIDINTFLGSSIEEIYLPESLEIINRKAFCGNIKKIYIAGNIDYIAENAFEYANDDMEFVLDTNAKYSAQMIDVLQSLGKTITYMDFNTLDF